MDAIGPSRRNYGHRHPAEERPGIRDRCHPRAGTIHRGPRRQQRRHRKRPGREFTISRSGPDSTLGNVSTRGFVGAGDNAMIGGLIIGSGGTPIVVLRAIGPTLASAGIYPTRCSIPRSIARWQRHRYRLQRRLEKRPGASRGGDSIRAERRSRISHRRLPRARQQRLRRRRPRAKATTPASRLRFEAYRIP